MVVTWPDITKELALSVFPQQKPGIRTLPGMSQQRKSSPYKTEKDMLNRNLLCRGMKY